MCKRCIPVGFIAFRSIRETAVCLVSFVSLLVLAKECAVLESELLGDSACYGGPVDAIKRCI